MASKDAREARRKRILERGSDRLAYIAGERKTAPLSFPNSLSAVGSNHEVEVQPLHLPDPNRLSDDDPRKAEQLDDPQEVASGQSRLDHEREESQRRVAFNEAVSDLDTEQLPQLPCPQNNQSLEPQLESLNGIERYKKPGQSPRQQNISAIFRRLSSSFDGSQGVRGLCALSLALLLVCRTVLLACGFSLGSILDALSPRWPIFLVFITDLTVAFGMFLLRPVGELVELEEREVERDESISHLLNMVGKLEVVLSMGLLCKKAISAISLDCSIYILVVTCGLSLSQYWLSFSCY